MRPALSAFYTAAPSLNYQDFSVGTNGRYDIQKEWNTYGGLSYSRLHEQLGTPNTVNGQTSPNVYYLAAGNVGYYETFGRINVRIDGRVDNYNYVNNAFVPGLIPNSDRNRTEIREALRLGYEFLPGYQIWARGGFNQRLY
jgi:hypothetical protein